MLSGYEAVLALYERKVGPNPEKVCHFFFSEHVLLEDLGKNHEKRVKEDSLFSVHWGTIECT